MSKLIRVMAAAAHSVARLLLAERRDWAEAVRAEAHAVPPGLTRLAWRAGGVWVLAGRRCRGPDGVRAPANVRIGQGAAGLLANGLAAMFTTVLGTGATSQPCP